MVRGAAETAVTRILGLRGPLLERFAMRGPCVAPPPRLGGANAEFNPGTIRGAIGLPVLLLPPLRFAMIISFWNVLSLATLSSDDLHSKAPSGFRADYRTDHR